MGEYKKNLMVPVLLVLGLLLWSLSVALAGPITGEVVGITDGDTLTLLTPDKRQVKVRLSEIDTPESGQPYGSRSRQALAALTFRKQATLYPETTDRYGRTVGRIVVGSVDVNAEMVRSGHAWVYRKYANREMLYDLEKEAQQTERGLWSLPEAQRVPPWRWRELTREGRSIQQAALETAEKNRQGAEFDCARKPYCGDMASCEEARFFLNECGLKRLDRDEDGIPCESICQ